jgi:hypothetical protein
MNRASESDRYLTPAGVVIESAFAWTIAGIAFYVTHWLKSDTEILLRGVFETAGVCNIHLRHAVVLI